MPNAAPEWQASSLGWLSRETMEACPLGGLFEALTINFQLEVEEARNTMMNEVLWPISGSMYGPFPGKPEMVSLLRFCQREYLLHRTMLQITERASPLL